MDEQDELKLAKHLAEEIDLRRLLEHGEEYHWSQDAACGSDPRFTGRYTALGVLDHFEMHALCELCPVFRECESWAYQDNVTDVFAAGYWRHHYGNPANSD